jgi:SAM-dependent methyltransferase
VDTVWRTGDGTPGNFAEAVFARAAKFGAFDRSVRRVVEIGTGAGMFVPALQRRCRPESYESYEPDPDWAAWLAREYHLLSHECDGVSLRQTPDASVDLVVAHGVFVVLPFLTTAQYFRESARVLRPGGHAVFDVTSEQSLGSAAAVDAWLASEWRFPVLLTTAFVREFLRGLGFAFAGDFVAAAFEGGRLHTHYLVFRREK